MKTRRPRWKSGDEFIEFCIEHRRSSLAKLGVSSGRGDAVRTWLRMFKGQPAANRIAGYRFGHLASEEEMLELKALFFDWLIQVAPPAATSLLAHQRERSRRGVARRVAQGSETARRVLLERERLVKQGMPERNLAAAIAKRVGFSATHVRAILKKAKVSQG